MKKNNDSDDSFSDQSFSEESDFSDQSESSEGTMVSEASVVSKVSVKSPKSRNIIKGNIVKGFQEFKDFKVVVENSTEILDHNTNVAKDQSKKDSSIKDSSKKDSTGKVESMQEINQMLIAWVLKQDNCIKKDKVLKVLQGENGFSCVFKGCGKIFKNYNGLLYHLQKFMHSLKEIMDIDALQDFTKCYKVEGLKVKFQEKKKIYEVDVLMENVCFLERSESYYISTFFDNSAIGYYSFYKHFPRYRSPSFFIATSNTLD
jgi:hypothetical protein